MKTVSAVDWAAETLPAASTAAMVIKCFPSASAEVTVNVVPVALSPLICAPLSKKRKLGAPATVNDGVVILVMLSATLTPESLADWRSGAMGVPGAVVSIVTESGG